MEGMLMKKLLKQILLISFTAMLLFVALPVRSEAFGEQYKEKFVSAGTLRAGKWTHVKGDATYATKKGSTYTRYSYLYKITVPANCYIKIENKAGSVFKFIDVWERKNKKFKFTEIVLTYYDDKAATFCLKKGTYYLSFSRDDDVCLNIIKQKNTNSSKNKAKKLIKGKVETFADNGERWFKIVVPTKKMVRIITKDITKDKYTYDYDYSKYSYGASTSTIGWSIYDSKGIKYKYYSSPYPKIEYDESYRAYIFKKRLPKGVYYIRFSGETPPRYNLDRDDKVHCVKMIMWK